MGPQQDVLNGRAHGHHALQTRDVGFSRAESCDGDQQRRSAVRFLASGFDLSRRSLGVSIEKDLRKGLGQAMAL